ncbi:hypothetical protein [Neobacillus thermocopriae]
MSKKKQWNEYQSYDKEKLTLTGYRIKDKRIEKTIGYKLIFD